jgi:hypothetical protein
MRVDRDQQPVDPHISGISNGLPITVSVPLRFKKLMARNVRHETGRWPLVSIRLMQGWPRMERHLPLDVRLKKGEQPVVLQ